MTKDEALERHLERIRSKITLPTPHGRALAPWREFVEPEGESGLPAQDQLKRRTEG